MKFKKILFFFALLPLLSFSVHKYYISLTQIVFKEDQKSIQIITNVFMDDVEHAINKEYDVDMQLTTKAELPNVDEYFKKYLTENIHFNINKTPKKFTFIGKEYEGDIVYFYLEIENIEDVKSIEIENTLLQKYFPDQQNLIKSKVRGKHKSVLLNKANNKGLLNF